MATQPASEVDSFDISLGDFDLPLPCPLSDEITRGIHLSGTEDTLRYLRVDEQDPTHKRRQFDSLTLDRFAQVDVWRETKDHGYCSRIAQIKEQIELQESLILEVPEEISGQEIQSHSKAKRIEWAYRERQKKRQLTTNSQASKRISELQAELEGMKSAKARLPGLADNAKASWAERWYYVVEGYTNSATFGAHRTEILDEIPDEIQKYLGSRTGVITLTPRQTDAEAISGMEA